MALTAHISRYKTQLIDACFVVILLLFSFPNFEPDFNVGLDAPFRWAYNYLFAFEYDKLIDLRYTYGPLAFIKVPVAIHHNFAIALISYNILKASFAYQLVKLGRTYLNYIAYPLVFVLGYFVSVDQAIIGLVAVTCFRFFDDKSIIKYIIVLLISLLGFYIKPQIGINCFAMIFMLVAVITWRERNFRLSMRMIILGLVFMVCSSAIIGRSAFYFFEFLYSSLRLSSEYSSSLSLFPANNWILLTVYIASVLSIPFILKKEYLNRSFLLLPVLFFTWKYGMVREEFLYYVRMLDSVVVIWGILLLSSEFKKVYWYAIPVLAITVLFINLTIAKAPDKEYHKTLLGYSNFSKAVLNYDNKVSESNRIAAQNIHANRLPKNIREEIGSQSIDFFPWDISYAPANNLNWQPRTAFQSTGVSGWADDAYQKDFSLENGPAYVLFHYVNDTMGGQLGGIDYRYLLNFSPHTTTALMNNYSIVHTSEKWALLKQNLSPNLKSGENIKSQNMTWEQWYDCPSTEKGILKLYIEMDYSFLGKLIQLVYKDTQYMIDIELENGAVKPYRFIASMAKNGLWINPFLTNFDSNEAPQKVKRIRFRTDNKMFRSPNFTGNWELLKASQNNSHYFIN